MEKDNVVRQCITISHINLCLDILNDSKSIINDIFNATSSFWYTEIKITCKCCWMTRFYANEGTVL